MGFEPTISVFERAKTVHALDRAATVVAISLMNTDYKTCHHFQFFDNLRDDIRLKIRNKVPAM
jgi:hypothetical protein